MARTYTEILEQTIADFQDLDPSVDLVAGPIRDIIEAVVTRVQENEETAEHLSLLYSAAFAAIGSDTEIEAFTSNYGIGKDQGRYASTTQYFCAYSRPAAGSQFTIPRGTVVATGGGYAFRTQSSTVIDGDNADNYYNPATRCYETSATVNAVLVGEDYNVAAYTITALQTPITGIDKSENRTPATGGSSVESNASTIVRAQTRMLGGDKGTYGGILADASNYDPTNTSDVSLVFQSDWPLFQRTESRPAVDVYVIGSVAKSSSYTYTAPVGGGVTVVLDKQPVLSVSSVTRNGAVVAYTFIADTTNAVTGSTRAADYVQLAALLAGDVVVIEYAYNSLLYDMQNALFATNESADSRTRLFDTDILVRGPVTVAISVSVYVRVLASFDPLSVQAAVTDLIYTYVESEMFVGVLYPTELRNQIESSIAGVASASMRTFTKTNAGFSEIETVELEKNEMPYVDTTALLVDVSL